jgi:hypothetical protein
MLYIRGYAGTTVPFLWTPASDFIEEALKSFINTPRNLDNNPVYTSVEIGEHEHEGGVEGEYFNSEIIYGPHGIYYLRCDGDQYQLRYM